jgi:hypothetical protein
MKILKLKFYADAGHGWLAVKRKLVKDLNIHNKITLYSYQKGDTVYLEEDCDASLFMDVAKAAGYEVQVDSRYYNKTHPIRSYERYVDVYPV